MPELEDIAVVERIDETADCDDCKWLMGFEYHCLLGRSPHRCANNPARRGDDELVARLLALSETEQGRMKQRFENTGEGLRRLESQDAPEGS